MSRCHSVSGCTDLRPPLNITVICSFESTTFAEQKCCSKKKDTPTGVFLFGAGDEARTRYLDLGKVALYQMSYARI